MLVTKSILLLLLLPLLLVELKLGKPGSHPRSRWGDTAPLPVTVCAHGVEQRGRPGSQLIHTRGARRYDGCENRTLSLSGTCKKKKIARLLALFQSTKTHTGSKQTCSSMPFDFFLLLRLLSLCRSSSHSPQRPRGQATNDTPGWGKGRCSTGAAGDNEEGILCKLLDEEKCLF